MNIFKEKIKTDKYYNIGVTGLTNQLISFFVDNIYEKSIEYIYKDSLYLKKARELVKSHVGCISCEQCVGQYYLGKSMEEDINDK